MPFSDEEKVQIRHHLGYLNVAQAQVFVLGSPAAAETQFLIEGAMNRVLSAAETKARELLGILNGVEAQVVDNQELLAVTQVDEIHVRQDEFRALIERYHYWRNALANILGCYPNPFDKRFFDWAGGGGGLNARVVNG